MNRDQGRLSDGWLYPPQDESKTFFFLGISNLLSLTICPLPTLNFAFLCPSSPRNNPLPDWESNPAPPERCCYVPLPTELREVPASLTLWDVKKKSYTLITVHVLIVRCVCGSTVGGGPWEHKQKQASAWFPADSNKELQKKYDALGGIVSLHAAASGAVERDARTTTAEIVRNKVERRIPGREEERDNK